MSNQTGIHGNIAAYETAALRKVIEDFNEQANKQTHQMLRLTKVIAYLTGVMTIGLLVQIYIAIVN